MKRNWIIILLIFLTLSTFSQKDSSSWISSFRQLRNALYNNDKTTLKSYFEFPFNNGGNEIWYIIYSENDKALSQLKDSTRLLTEKDFQKYSSKLFPKQLIKCLQRIKVEELYKTGESQSPEIKDSIDSFILYAKYDKSKQLLELNLLGKYKIKNGNEYEIYESSFGYYLKILNKRRLQFQKIFTAD